MILIAFGVKQSVPSIQFKGAKALVLCAWLADG
jgi:hypothetical protein